MDNTQLGAPSFAPPPAVLLLAGSKALALPLIWGRSQNPPQNRVPCGSRDMTTHILSTEPCPDLRGGLSSVV